MLKYKADRRTVVFLLLVAVLFFVQWLYLERWNPFLYVVYLYFSITVSVIAHNQNHVPMWRSKFMNDITDYWITAFYGFPTFAWIPTHNKNHHKFNNKDGDYTITYRVTEGNHIGSLSSYPPVSSYFQQSPIKEYLVKTWKKDKSLFFFYIGQYALLATMYAVGFWIDWRKALLYMIIPHQVALNTVLIFNYIQHVHANEMSKFDHSRNFVSKLTQLMLFNNGLHTAHHENATMHWSLLPEAHAKIADKISPELNQRGFWPYIIKTYILGIFFKKFRTTSMRLERIAREKSIGLSAK